MICRKKYCNPNHYVFVGSIKEFILSLTESGLRFVEDYHPGDKEFTIWGESDGHVLAVGCGDGFIGFVAAFTYDDNGTLIGHSVYE